MIVFLAILCLAVGIAFYLVGRTDGALSERRRRRSSANAWPMRRQHKTYIRL